VDDRGDEATNMVMRRKAEAPMSGAFYSIASDFQRGAMIQVAMRRAGEIARESFYHGLMVGDLGGAELAFFAEDAWGRFSMSVTFDYPDYAHSLFLRAYEMAYRAYADDLPRGIHPNTFVLAELLEEEVRQAHDHH
jgi:hypothetical protein